VPWLRQLVTGFSPQSPRFNPRSFHVRFVVDKMVMGQDRFSWRKSNKMQQCIKLFVIPHLYEAQHILGYTLPIIRSLKLHWQHLVFHTWKVVGCVVGRRHCAWQCPPATHPTAFHVWKTRGCQYSFRLLMTGGVLPETRWASYKYGIIKILIHCCILLDFLYE
jgi:hypothetical protein